jgi:hypothetical protein
MFNEQQTANPLETLVGEGKKFQTTEDLAKGKLEADSFIEQLKQEAQQKAEDILKMQTELEIYRRLQANTPPTVKPNEVTTPPDKAPEKTNDSVDLAARIREELSRAEAEKVSTRNVAEVKEVLIRTYGNEQKAAEVLKQKAEEMGVSTDFLSEVAAKSPKAFYAQFGLDTSPKGAQGITSDVNTAAFSNTTSGVREGTYKWFEQLRQTNPTLYHSPKTQNQMFQAAKKLGSAFYS